MQPGVLIDQRFQFGAIGAEERTEGNALGYWFPGSEGEETYTGNTYPGGQLHQWRRRFHPLRDGFEQQYEVAFRFGSADGLAACCSDSWRWAWRTLKPQVNPHDIAATRRYIVDTLADNVVEVEDRAGIPNALPAVAGERENADPSTVMGFTGKALESAEFMLAEARLDDTARGAELRRKAEKIIASFLRMKMAPPEAEGFFIHSGKLTTALGHRKQHPEMYLRSFGDDVKALLRAYQHEKQDGRTHAEWLAWARQFADWLLTQQQPAGGFPRAWLPATRRGVLRFTQRPVSTPSRCLVQMHRLSGDGNYP